MSVNPASYDVILAIDTAGPRLQLALMVGEMVDSHSEELARGHAEVIFDRIADLLTKNNVAYGNLTKLAVTTGPGSFTGLRIGLSAARGLALGLDIPIIGIGSLTAMSLSGPTNSPFAILVDARREEAYFQEFSAPGKPKGDAEILPLSIAEQRGAKASFLLQSPSVDIAHLVRMAAEIDPEAYPPTPAYIRAADAKPQIKGKVARVAGAAR